MRRRRALTPIAAALTRTALIVACAMLTTACVTQPVDETALTGLDQRMGATPAAIDAADAERVAAEATSLTRRKTSGAKHRDWIWTGPRGKRDAAKRGGGLVRDDKPTTPDGEPGAAREPADRKRRRPVREEPRAGSDTGGTGTREQPRQPRDNEQPRDGEPDAQPPRSPRPNPPTQPEFRAIAGVTDGNGDASGQSPAYADIRQLLIESDGRNARVTVAVAGDIPGALSAGEVQGIGVDFYRSDNRESDYQLFVDGDDEGWRAFLQTPDGVVQYPGSFAVGGGVFVLELPWSSLGGRTPADVDMFIDWSKRKTPLNDSGNDRAPQSGRVRVDPS